MTRWKLFIQVVIACCVLMSVGAAPLPRVLMIGDEVYREISAATAKELAEQAHVVHQKLPGGEVVRSSSILTHLDTLLGEEQWDLIHFNVGLGDLIHRAPRINAFRVLPIDAGGVRTTDPELYEKNLRELVKRLKATQAKLVWASTTPIRASATNVFELGSEIQYNAIAAKVMTENRIPINDMYSHVKEAIDMNKPASHGFDPFFFDRKPIHEPVVAVIKSQLRLR